MGSPVLEAPLTITTDEASEEVLPSREIVKVLYVDENCVSSIQPPENNGRLIRKPRQNNRAGINADNGFLMVSYQMLPIQDSILPPQNLASAL